MDENHLYTSEEKLKWWGYGEWVEESDEVDFDHEGIKCKVFRVVAPDGPIREDGTQHIFGGHLCGYISIPTDHPYFSKDYNDIEIDVHGGLTYGENINDEYWIGFDCAHSFDFIPSLEKFKYSHPFNDIFPNPEEFKDYAIFIPTYKNVNFCIEECKSMAEQLKNMVIS